MPSFVELAEKYQFSPVRTGDGKLNGYLHLDGKKTKAVLNTKDFHHFEDDENGWFDVELEDKQGSTILLHNSLTQNKSMSAFNKGGRGGSYTFDIFPNIVVVGAENLRKDRTLQHLSFEFEGAERFFIYNTIEWHSLYKQPNRKELLKTIREEAWKPERKYRFREYVNDPHEVYVIHHPKRYLDVRVEDMRITVWHSRSQRGLGWTGHEIKVTPIISVAFEKPVSVDEAIDRVWRIKGFFDQLALCDLHVRAINFSKFKKGWPTAEVYLPNEAYKADRRRLDLHRTEIPFSRWEERKRFADCLQAWLGSSASRRFFRSAVRVALVRFAREIDPTLVTLLTAGVESLPELRGPSGISREVITQMADAAHKVDPSVELSAIRGLLGILRLTSPKERVRKLAAKFLDKAEIETFADALMRFRNQIAHGKAMN